ncbi:MAG TPA: OadG-related small transporter subunit [Candidatus Cloacimonadota bacterium]|jgi:Na+-transporting methylmalonyl-CoA/oxaloacetate decarboxylase gamma subunit|nr:OadG-related small transporter subunit [Candidatus Cloacimonadota bacterium]HOF59289.1 OadG-related small transporter subunit [Candidatus Cloacimonadota bacterium]HOR58392.1 OadG-related small transporter subunit [Candidatus Cloacimonadota bacterium]HPB08754.1 OadG-related small transporter subunit [Candidatus Cloacimonadota bacterium]HPL23517.1 OadG-related small transporter subunit [Candidatus Cloacimonadota bacterium]
MTPDVQATVMQNFVSALKISALGMGGIFLFMAILYGLIYLLEQLFKERETA